jgi:hypothetical protein
MFVPIAGLPAPPASTVRTYKLQRNTKTVEKNSEVIVHRSRHLALITVDTYASHIIHSRGLCSGDGRRYAGERTTPRCRRAE